MLTKKDVVARPGGVYTFIQVKGLDWLASPLSAMRFRQSMPDLASGPMGDGSLHTGPTSNAWRCAVDELDLPPRLSHAKGKPYWDQEPKDCGLGDDCPSIPDYLREFNARYGGNGECHCVKVKQSWVYFIQAGVGDIKIGTATDVKRRLAALQTSHSMPLKVLAATLGGRDVEAAYHAKYAAHRLKGEWFICHPDIWREVKRLNRKHENAPGGCNAPG